MRFLSPVVAALAFAAGPVAPQEPSIPGPSFKDILSVTTIGSPAISPDGGSVAYTVRSADWEKNEYDTEIWLVRVGEEPIQLTRTEHGSSTTPRWSPDGRWIAFLATRDEQRQIHLIAARGGEAWALTEVKQDVQDFRWSPDGRRIAFTMNEPEREADEQRTERYGEFAVEDSEYRQRHLWLLEFPHTPTRVEARQLTEGDAFTVADFAWSPDGASLVFEHRPDPLINSWMHADISILDIQSRTITPLVEVTGYDGNPQWSPDGRWIVYQSSGPDTTSLYYTNRRLYKIPADGGDPVRLAADLDEHPSLVDWNPTGIYVLARERTKRHLLRVDPDSGTMRLVGDAPEYIWSVSFSADGRTLAIDGRTPTPLDEIHHTTLTPYRPRPLTSMSDPIEGWALGTSEVVTWTSRDGTPIEGVLHKPDDFDARRRYPLLVVIHGGPAGIDFPTALLSSVYPVHQWLAKGAVVLRPNYRGSAGYGEAFRSLNVRNLGVGDAWDVLTGVDHLVTQGFVDTTRMGAMGWSQGGYISAFLTTNSDRFAAISVGAGISNWTTYYVNTDIHPFTRQYLKATPWDDPDIYAKTSPMTNIKQASTPTLIQHGEFDRRVPIPNAYELYQGLRDQGVDTKLIVYKGFGHGITKPKERLAAMWHNWQWFGRYLWGETIELPVEVTTTDEVAAESQ